LLTTAMTAACAFGGGAWAQTAPAKDQGTSLDEVVVTATLQPTRLQDTPVAVSSISPDVLKTTGLTDNRSLQLLVPSLTFTSGPSVNSASFALRGVGTESTSILTEQSVSLVINGVVQGIQGQALGQLVDIDHIEVLRGPQGMLFGKNASAGVINVVTKDPILGEFHFTTHDTYASHDDALATATVNMPIGDNQALRVSAFSHHRDGLIHNIVRDDWENDDHGKGVRGKYLWQPNDNLRVILEGDYSEDDQTAGEGTILSAGPGTRVAIAAAGLGITPGPDNLVSMEGGPQWSRAKNGGLSLTAKYQLGDYSLTSISAWRKYSDEFAFDPDGSPDTITEGVDSPQHEVQTSQEFRIASPTENRLSWVGGLFYFRKNVVRTETSYGTFNIGSPPRPPGVLISSGAVTTALDNSSYAAFGRATFKVTDRFSVFGGARYTREDYEISNHTDPVAGYVGFPPTFIQPTNSQTGTDSESNLSWQAGAQFKLTDRIMAYFTATRGYKGPTPLNDTPTSISLSKPEIPMAYEAGLKTSWLDNRLILNLAAYHTLYKDFQAAAFDFQAVPPVARITNAGSLLTQGVELDATARPISGLTLNTNVSYLNAYYKSFVNDSCWLGQTVAEGCVPTSVGTAVVTDSTGNQLSNAPHWTVSAYANWQHPLTDKLDYFITGNYFYKSHVFWSSTNSPFTQAPGYSTFGASIGLADADAGWRVSIFAKNIFDNHYAARIQDVASAQRGDAAQWLDPDGFRFVGVSLDFSL
jgi:iron complex outermembrane receptor protein